jgi:hypothetical protein
MNQARTLCLGATILIALAVGAPSAPASGGPIIPSGVYGGDGPTGPGAKPGSEFRYVTVGAGSTIIERISTADGTVGRFRSLSGSWATPAVTVLGEAGGLSADGRTLVLVKPAYGPRGGTSRMLVLDTNRFETRRRVALDGTFSFDAISPDGGLLYLVQYASPRDPLDYRVRQFDLARGEFRGGAVVDPDEPEEKMTGQPVARATSSDGSWVYTLYGGGHTFVHALNTELGQAQCVDLDQFGPRQLYTLGLAVDPRSGEITVLHKNEPAATIDPQTLVVGPPPAPEGISPASSQGASAAWVGPAAIALGVAVAIGAILVTLRRRRRAIA